MSLLENKKRKLRRSILDGLKEKFSSKEESVLTDRFDEVMEALNDKISTQFITKISPDVVVKNLKEVLEEVEKTPRAVTIDSEVEIFGEVKIKNAVKLDGPVQIEGAIETFTEQGATYEKAIHVKQDHTDMMEFVKALFGALMGGLLSLQKRVSTVRLTDESYRIPQRIILVDPKTMQDVRPQDIVDINISQMTRGGGAPSGGVTNKVGIKGALSVDDGTTEVTTAGTRVQLPDISCSRVFIQAHPANADIGSAGAELVIGGANVVASASTRRGLMLYGSQWQEFRVSNLSHLFIDSTEDAGKINYMYEI